MVLRITVNKNTNVISNLSMSLVKLLYVESLQVLS